MSVTSVVGLVKYICTPAYHGWRGAGEVPRTPRIVPSLLVLLHVILFQVAKSLRSTFFSRVIDKSLSSQSFHDSLSGYLMFLFMYVGTNV